MRSIQNDDTNPQKHHLDRRAASLIAAGEGPADDLLTTEALAEWLGTSTQFLEIGRCKEYGPRFIKIGSRVRYRRSDVLAWLDERTRARTGEA